MHVRSLNGPEQSFADGRIEACQVMNRARSLKRVFDFDLEHYPACGGELKIIDAILEQPVIEKMLSHRDVDPQSPPKDRAREAGYH